MKNIFVLPTDKPSRLHNKNGELGNYPSTKLYIEDFKGNQYNSFHIYITSNEEISGLENNIWVYNNGRVWLWENTMALRSNNKPKKIILTTDQDLIKDGVQTIDDEFLEWFIKNPSCVFVEINNVIDATEGLYKLKYKIIIPKEESKKPSNFYEKLKEYFKTTPREKVLEDWNKSAHLDNVGPTVDEFIENSERERLENIFHEIDDKLVRYSTEESEFWHHYKVGVLDGLKWQQEQEKNKYNDEDLRTAYFSGIKSTGEGWNGEYANGNNPSIEEEFQEGFQEWFKQYKKK
jgi:hypothetical protein